EELVVKLDTPTRQVLIEARLMEISRSPSSVKGIDWTDTLASQRFTFGNGFATGTTTTTIPGDTTTTLPSGRVVTTPGTATSTTTLTTDVGDIGRGGLSAN